MHTIKCVQVDAVYDVNTNCGVWRVRAISEVSNVRVIILA